MRSKIVDFVRGKSAVGSVATAMAHRSMKTLVSQLYILYAASLAPMHRPRNQLGKLASCRAKVQFASHYFHDDELTAAVEELGARGEHCDVCEKQLLQMVFTSDTGREALVRWINSFPFALTLPSQPMLIERHVSTESDDGLDLIFRRKPTAEKGSRDGGMRFIFEFDATPQATLRVERICEGAIVEKIFSERAIVSALCSSAEASDSAVTVVGVRSSV